MNCFETISLFFFFPHTTKSPWYWLPILKFLFVSSKLSTSKFHSLIENIFVPFFFFPKKMLNNSNTEWSFFNNVTQIYFLHFTNQKSLFCSVSSYTKCHPVLPVILAFHIFSIFIILYKLYYILLYYIIYNIITTLFYLLYYYIESITP